MDSGGKLNITDWALADRPREKLMAQGAATLTNAELLAILIGSGSTHETAVQLMQRVLHDCGDNLNTLGKCSVADLMAYHGIGEAKAVTLVAACELGRRRQREKAEERPAMQSADDIYAYMLPRMQDLDVEEAWILLLNQGCRLIKAMRISHGGISETAVDVRVIIREAVLCNATVVALCHNHPSRNARPSGDDDRITACVQKACQTMRLYFLDHLIVTDGQYYSYRNEGKL